jgi:hypothetical protein
MTHLYAYLAQLSSGTGTFYRELSEAERPSVMGSDNVYREVSEMWADNNYGG